MCTGGEFLDIFRPVNGEGQTLAMELHNVLKKYLADKSLIYIGKEIFCFLKASQIENNIGYLFFVMFHIKIIIKIVFL